jgi:hypothetical protein
MFDNIIWSANENLSDDKLKRMANNDRLNYRRALLAPAGLLASGFINEEKTGGGPSSTSISFDNNGIFLGRLIVVNKFYIPSDMTRFYQINIGSALIRLQRQFTTDNWPNFHNIDLVFTMHNASQTSSLKNIKKLTFRSSVGPRFATNANDNFSWANNQTSRSPLVYRTTAGQLFFASSIFANSAPDDRNKFVVDISAELRVNDSFITASIAFKDLYFDKLDAAFPITIEDIGGDAGYAGLP